MLHLRLPKQAMAFVARSTSVVLLVLTGGCVIGMGQVATTGTLSEARSQELSLLRSLQVQVLGGEEFSVLLHGDREGYGAAALLGPWLGSAIARGNRASKDRELAAVFDPLLEGWSPLSQLETLLLHHLESSGRFEHVDRGQLAVESTAGRCVVVVNTLGLLLAAGSSFEEGIVQVGVDAVITIRSSADNSTLWSYRDIYRHGEGRPLTDYEAQPELLRRELDASIEEVAIRLSSTIRRIIP